MKPAIVLGVSDCICAFRIWKLLTRLVCLAHCTYCRFMHVHGMVSYISSGHDLMVRKMATRVCTVPNDYG